MSALSLAAGITESNNDKIVLRYSNKGFVDMFVYHLINSDEVGEY